MTATMLGLLRSLLMQPASQQEYVLSMLLGSLVFVLVMNKVGTVMGLKAAESLRSLAVLAITVGAVLLLQVAAIRFFQGSGWALIGAAAVAVLVIGAPAVCGIQKGEYGAALFALLLSLAAAAVVVLFVHTGFRSFKGGEKSVGRGLQHNRETETFISN